MECPNCKKRNSLVCAYEYTTHGKIEVIKCLICGYRVERTAPTEEIPIMKKQACEACGQVKKIAARGMCGTCYVKSRKAEPELVMAAEPTPETIEPAVAPVPDPVVEAIVPGRVVLNFTSQRDRDLFDRLTRGAEDHRQQIDQHILFLLDEPVTVR